ncbi:MAG TPA: cyclic peptide export ABC transporter [Methylomirabilota bacterium]|nr:cyclic peptide export ABC transporter [Methylomirabilota bacterium]
MFSFVPVRSWLAAAVSVVAGLAAGAFGAGLVAVINTALHNSGPSLSLLAFGFCGLLVGRTLANAAARLLLNQFTQDTLCGLSRNLSRRVLATPLWELERIGIARILATLTHDVAMLGWAAQNLPSFATNVAVIAGCAIYLGRLSSSILLVLTSVMVLGAGVYRILIGRAYRYLQRTRNTRDVLFQHFRALTEGTKELKLHAARREAFFVERIETATDALRRDALAGVQRHVLADAWSQLLFYGLIGGVLFTAPAVQGIGSKTLTGYIVAMLYVMTPVWGVMEVWSVFAQARISLKKVQELGLSLDGAEPVRIGTGSQAPAECDWEWLEFESVRFSYTADSEGRAFALGPLDFTLKKGELVFLIGGNGSGKSTLMKVLTGLYVPQAGRIRLDGRTISERNQEWYCRHFSAVFTDFYLFDSLLGLDAPDLDQRAGLHLAKLELEAKVQVSGGAFSTTALSQGQRKRLALLTAFLEDRAIYIFDEWAADQDPHYRQIFYERLLPELKSRGKTIVVISHDDRYYSLGDRVVKLEDGRITGDTPTSREH